MFGQLNVFDLYLVTGAVGLIENRRPVADGPTLVSNTVHYTFDACPVTLQSPSRPPVQRPSLPAMGGAERHFPSLMLYNLVTPHGCSNEKTVDIL